MAAVRSRNWFAIWMSVVAVVAIVAIGGVVVWLNSSSNPTGVMPAASNIDTETGAISFGDGPDTVATYVDFMCPICNTFEQAYGDTLQELVDDGSITLDVHPVSILDRASQGTEYSTRAANAMYCVAEFSPEAAMPFMQSMYANQPEEGSSGLTDEQIIGLAEDAGASGVTDCITDQTYRGFVADKTTLMPPDDAGRRGTPTVVFNGERIDLTGDPQADIVARLS